LSGLPVGRIILFIVSGLMLPLFPIHGLYVMALTRLRGYLPVIFGLLLPAAGLWTIRPILNEIPAEVLDGVGMLALLGALYGSLMAFVQFRVENLLAYTGLSYFSVLWWYLARTGDDTPQATIYAGAAVLVTGGLLFVWRLIQKRFGNLDLHRI